MSHASASASFGLGSSGGLFGDDVKEGDVWEKGGQAPGSFAFFPVSKHVFQIRW